MKKFDGKKFIRDCLRAYFLALGGCALMVVLSHWFIGFDMLEKYMEGITILLAAEIPMGMAIFEFFGSDIWIRRLIFWLFTTPMLYMFGVFLGGESMLNIKSMVWMIVVYAILLACAYLIADEIERRKLKKINEQLEKNV